MVHEHFLVHQDQDQLASEFLDLLALEISSSKKPNLSQSDGVNHNRAISIAASQLDILCMGPFNIA
jgi:hypothetical protein